MNFYSCRETASSFQVTRIIQNSTEYDVRIDVFDFEGLMSESLEIPPFSADTAMAICRSDRGYVYSCPVEWVVENMDSVTLTFANTKIVRYCEDFYNNDCKVNNKNIMAFINGGYDGGYDKLPESVYVFEITDEDYDVAVPLNE